MYYRTSVTYRQHMNLNKKKTRDNCRFQDCIGHAVIWSHKTNEHKWVDKWMLAPKPELRVAVLSPPVAELTTQEVHKQRAQSLRYQSVTLSDFLVFPDTCVHNKIGDLSVAQYRTNFCTTYWVLCLIQVYCHIVINLTFQQWTHHSDIWTPHYLNFKKCPTNELTLIKIK